MGFHVDWWVMVTEDFHRHLSWKLWPLRFLLTVQNFLHPGWNWSCPERSRWCVRISSLGELMLTWSFGNAQWLFKLTMLSVVSLYCILYFIKNTFSKRIQYFPLGIIYLLILPMVYFSAKPYDNFKLKTVKFCASFNCISSFVFNFLTNKFNLFKMRIGIIIFKLLTTSPVSLM
jgi:hypothetical protein